MATQTQERRPRRWSKRTLRIMSWAVGAIGFALPWGILRAVPRVSQPGAQVVVVPAGSQVVINRGAAGSAGVTVLAGPSSGRTASTAPATVTGASHPVP